MPEGGHEALVAGIAVPGRHRRQRLVATGAQRRLRQHRQQRAVEAEHRLVDRLVRASIEMDGDVGAQALELALVQEPQAGCRERQQGCRPVLRPSEGGGGARHVVVLQEARQMRLTPRLGAQAVANPTGIAVAQAVIERLVVGDVEPLPDQPVLQPPIDLRHEADARMQHPRRGDRVRPERRHAAAVQLHRPGASQRTPSHWLATESSISAIAVWVSGLA